jgi:hypothetical protein
MPPPIDPNCQAVDRSLDRGRTAQGSQLSTKVQHHLSNCRRCRQLYTYLASPLTGEAVPEAVVAPVLSAVRQDLKPVAPIGSTIVIAFRLLTAFAVIFMAALSSMKMLGVTVMTIPQLAVISTTLVLGLVLLVWSITWQMRPGSLRRISDRASLGVVVSAIVLSTAALFPWIRPEAASFASRGWHCFGVGLSITAPAALLMWMLIRRGVPANPSSFGLTMGALAGLAGFAVLQYTCDLQNMAHLLVWHFGVLLVAMLAGMLAGILGQRFRDTA